MELEYKCKDVKELKKIVNLCLKNNIGFDFMNNLELYFYLYDIDDYNFKKSVLGAEVIYTHNFVDRSFK